jgi:mono/diheme cytochrome c family protein
MVTVYLWRTFGSASKLAARKAKDEMRIPIVVAVTLGSVLLSAQDSPKISKVGAVPTSPASGKEMFGAYCASCHGADGKGNGPAVPALRKQPADLTLLARQSGGKFPAMRVTATIRDGGLAAHGSKDMPVWGPILRSVSSENPGVADQRVSNLVNYIQSIQAK